MVLTIGLSDIVNMKGNAGQVYQPWSHPETTHCVFLMQNKTDAEDLLWTDVHTLLSGEEGTESDPASSSLLTKEKSRLLLPSSPAPPPQAYLIDEAWDCLPRADEKGGRRERKGGGSGRAHGNSFEHKELRVREGESLRG